jgi:homocysteine S-methyltransferase
VALNPAALNLDEEVRRFRYKVEAGAEFAVTHPVFDPADFEVFLRRIDDVRVPILVGVRPLESLRHAEYLANEVPGIRVPARYLERMREADEAGRAAAEGITIAAEVASALRPLAQGVHIWAQADRVEVVAAIIDAVQQAV